MAQNTAENFRAVPSLDTYTDKSTSEVWIEGYRSYNADTATVLEELSQPSLDTLTLRERFHSKLEDSTSKVADRLRGCGQIQATTTCKQGHEVKKYRYQCGEYRLCPMCAKCRSKELQREIWPLMKHIEAKPVVGYQWRFITLTTKTNGNQKEAVALALSAFTKLWRNMLKKPYVAGIRSLEFGPDTGNVHIHLLYYGPYVNQGDLSEAWGNLTGAPVVDVRLAIEKHGSLKGAVAEVLKYMTNYNKVQDKQLLIKCWKASKGRKLVQRYGLLYGRKSLERWVRVKIPKLFVPQVQEPSCCPICGDTDLITVIPKRGPPMPLHCLR